MKPVLPLDAKTGTGDRSSPPFIWCSPPGFSRLETGECDDLGAVYDLAQGFHALWSARLEQTGTPPWSEWQQLVMALHTPPEEAVELEEFSALGLRITGKACYLTGRSFSPDRDMAGKAANELLEMCRGLLPSGLSLHPACSTEEFEQYSGFTQADRENGKPEGGQFVEYLRQIEPVALTGTGENLYRFYPFRLPTSGWSQLSRALGEARSLFISLHPSWLYPEEQDELTHLVNGFAKLKLKTGIAESGEVTPTLEFYRRMLTEVTAGFIVRIYLVEEARALPGWLVKATGSALSFNESEPDFPASYERQEVADLGYQEGRLAYRNLFLLENELWGDCPVPARYERLRYLFSPADAATLFCPPGISRIEVDSIERPGRL